MKGVDINRLREIVGCFDRKRVVVVGDLIADEYIIGDTDRVSRFSGPDPQVPTIGGQAGWSRANALANLSALGAQTMALGVIGGDDTGRALVEALGSRGIDCQGILEDPARETIRKTRVMAGGFHTVRQQIVRIDREGALDLTSDQETRVLEFLSDRADSIDAVLLSDYGQGAITESLASQVIRMGSAEGWRLAADSRHRLPMFRGVTVACPNESEAGPAAGTIIHDDESLLSAGESLLKTLDLQQGLVITRGRLGMSVFQPGRPMSHLPLFLDCDAADVTGAGDTVASMLVLSLAAGASLLEAATLSSSAGSLAVMKRGTATVSVEEVLSALE